LLAGAFLVRAGAFTAEALLFYVFSTLAIVAGALLITQKNPTRAAMAFALVVLSTCGLFLLLAAPFLMAATTIIYAGAIVVTFLFVIMLAQQEGISDADQRSREPFLASLAGFLLLGAVLYALAMSYQDSDLDDRLRSLQGYFVEVQGFPKEAAQPNERMKQTADDLAKFLETFRQGDKEKNLPDARTLGGDALDFAVVNAEERVAEQAGNLETGRPVRWDQVESALHRVHEIGSEVNQRLGMFQPSPGIPLSPLSGPPPIQELRRDAQGRPQLPAENVAYLGRSLFTDYLIAVELAGTLLLVATVGAIAIAQRRPEVRS
jgi:NADH:ubiquinone oxidoreductase subunit 6 (subunit J)